MYIFFYTSVFAVLHMYVYAHTYSRSGTNTYQGEGVKNRYSLNNFATINSSLKYSWLCVHLTLCRCVFVSFLCVVLWEALEIGHREKKWAYKSLLLWSMGEWGQCSRFSWVHVHFDRRYRPSTDFFLVWGHIDGRYQLTFFWYQSISTVDFDRFLGEIDGRSNIDRIFK